MVKDNMMKDILEQYVWDNIVEHWENILEWDEWQRPP